MNNSRKVDVIQKLFNKSKGDKVLYDVLQKPLIANGVTGYDHVMILPDGNKLTLTTSKSFWYKIVRFRRHPDDVMLLNMVVNAFTMIVTLLFIMPWLHHFKRLSHNNTIQWMDYFNQRWVTILYTIFTNVFSTKDLTVVMGTYVPFQLLLSVGFINSKTLTAINRVKNINPMTKTLKHEFTRSFMNVMIMFVLMTMMVKGTAMSLPDAMVVHADTTQKLMGAIKNYHISSFDNRSGYRGAVSMIADLCGYDRKGNLARKACHSFAEEMLPYFGRVWTVAGLQVSLNGYKLWQLKHRNGESYDRPVKRAITGTVHR